MACKHSGSSDVRLPVYSGLKRVFSHLVSSIVENTKNQVLRTRNQRLRRSLRKNRITRKRDLQITAEEFNQNLNTLLCGQILLYDRLHILEGALDD